MTTYFSPACFSLPDCFSTCKITHELPVTQLARNVDLFHLVIADYRRPETLSLPHGLAPPIKPTTHFQPSHVTLNPRMMALESGPISLSFPHMVGSLLGSTLHLLLKPRRGYRTLQPGTGPLAFVSCPLPNPGC
jgi:hypothetical protein